MKKIPLTLLIALGSTLFTNGAAAQNQPLACQTDAVGGLEWENGRWVTTSYLSKKFILVQTKDGFTKASAGKAMENEWHESISCIKDQRVTCFDTLGGYLLFDPKKLKGGISQLFGSTSDRTTKRDSVLVQIFSCTPF
jgi:hypothetical protein